MAASPSLIELEPDEVADLLKEGRILLVDVREPAEFDAEHIEGAVPFPLSTFDAAALPEAEGREIVFQCAAGGRSAKAVEASLAAGVSANRHLRGGLRAWKAAGLPTAA